MTGPPCQRPILRQSCPEGGLRGRDEGGFFTKYLFQFARILAFCFLGEFCHAVLPLPIPASIYGLVLLLAPLPNAAAMVGLMVCGLGCAPIYPSIIHSTPENFGASNALVLTGLQMAFAYVGSLVMSPLFGVLAEGVSPAIYPFYLAALLAVMALMADAVNRACRRA